MSNEEEGCIFFFQAEDGIRDKLVTGVQTCALPIFFRRAETRAEQKQAGEQCGSREVDFSHAVSEGRRQMTIGLAGPAVKLRRHSPRYCYLIPTKGNSDHSHGNTSIQVFFFVFDEAN